MKKIRTLLFSLLSLTAFAGPKVTLSPETQVQFLSGHGSNDAVQWEFKCTDGRRAGEWTKIAVPSCWELQGFGTYQYGMPFYGKADPAGIAKEQGLYKYTFRLPAEWEGRLIRLVFDGVMTDCSATINQRKAVKLHQGGFYRFKADVSDRVFFGKKDNVLEVTVSKESANSTVNMAERRADYWNFGGIFRPVFIEALPAQGIERVSIDAKADGSFKAEVNLTTALDGAYSLEAQVFTLDGKPVGSIFEDTVRAGSDKVSLAGLLTGIKPWTAETPNLYNVCFSLKNGSTVKHLMTERFAFRTIEVRPGDGLYINGSKVLIKGVNRHSFRPETGRTLSKQANYDDVKLIKSMNMNAVRLSHYPSDPELLDACDELGLYVMTELASWHQHYDTETGKQLVKEMLTRDANHPSVIWWSNGNEGGWNTELDDEFAAWDLQKRPLIHPQGNFGGFETMHYRSYGESQEYMRKPEIFMPTEFLHGLYDGGHGAGLYDYWELMRNHPRCAGGFLWVLADEGVVRTDQDGKIDNCGNYGADGIVGPHHEKEGSYYSVKEIWSPVQISTPHITSTFDGKLTVENRYDFTNLDQCRFEWKTVKFAKASENTIKQTILASGKLQGPSVLPHASGSLNVTLPTNWHFADALQLTAIDKAGNELWTWSWPIDKPAELPQVIVGLKPTVTSTADSCIVKVNNVALLFSVKTGELVSVSRSGKPITFGQGPRFIAARRADRSMDVYFNHDDPAAKSKERIYADISGSSVLKSFQVAETNDKVLLKATYFGNMTEADWTISNDGSICLDYEYRYDGVVELMGVKFEYPENQMLSKRWLGNGPYRVWQNRLQGPTLGVWKTDYNDPIPAESFTYPEFKGYFSNWNWVDFTTTEGHFGLTNGTPDSYLGVYTPRDGRDALLYTIPQSGISVLKVIPAVRNKVNSTDLNGPSAQAKWVSGLQKGRIWFNF
jgi:beta-galactosidase/beta-glucuronidase